MIGALVGIGGLAYLAFSLRMFKFGAGLCILGFCGLWIWATRDDADVRSMAEAKAERLAREEWERIQDQGRPYRA